MNDWDRFVLVERDPLPEEARLDRSPAERASDRAMLALARRWAKAKGWLCRGIVERRDLLGEPSRRAIFQDRNGDEHERTVDDLRAENQR